ncbi:hypothetical protein BHE74_00009147 [Ensete ventricosum]|nr:hypothetical protein BHE74_00009147 [Ensete ventricosum]RZS13887.1 hypothetical protein BHM03_00045577 [Ensete ventricosum]
MCPADYCSPAAADGTPTPETAPEEDGSTMPAPRDLAIAIMMRSESSSLPWSSRYLLFRNFARCFEISDAGWLDVRAAWRLLERVKISTPARIVLDNCCNRTKRRDAPHPARAGYRSLTRGQHP